MIPATLTLPHLAHHVLLAQVAPCRELIPQIHFPKTSINPSLLKLMNHHLPFSLIALLATSVAAPAIAQPEAPATEVSAPAPAAEKSSQKPAEVAALNGLTAAEKADGWMMLWDGKTTEGWRGIKSVEFPKSGWTIKEGILSSVANGGKESGGAIITLKQYSDFELELDFRLAPGAESGIEILAQADLPPVPKAGQKPATGSAIGLKFQLIDDARNPDAKLGKDGDRSIGSLYDLIPAAKDKKANPASSWNHVRIVCQDDHVEFFLNGVKTVAFDRDSDDFRKLVAASKFSTIPLYGEWADGHILLQDRGHGVSFCNIKLKPL